MIPPGLRRELRPYLVTLSQPTLETKAAKREWKARILLVLALLGAIAIVLTWGCR